MEYVLKTPEGRYISAKGVTTQKTYAKVFTEAEAVERRKQYKKLRVDLTIEPVETTTK